MVSLLGYWILLNGRAHGLPMSGGGSVLRHTLSSQLYCGTLSWLATQFGDCFLRARPYDFSSPGALPRLLVLGDLEHCNLGYIGCGLRNLRQFLVALHAVIKQVTTEPEASVRPSGSGRSQDFGRRQPATLADATEDL